MDEKIWVEVSGRHVFGDWHGGHITVWSPFQEDWEDEDKSVYLSMLPECAEELIAKIRKDCERIGRIR